MSTLKGRTALVTGASSGLGVDFARQLAARGADMILVARREAPMQTLAEELRQRYGATVTVIVQDLGAPGGAQSLYDRVQAAGLNVDVLVNNAGFGVYGRFTEIPWERERAMLELDLMVVVELTKLFVADMVARRYGYVMQIASIAAYQPSPLYASYAATKSFILSFGEALNLELKGTGVSCTVVSPGITKSEFLDVAGQQPNLFQRMTVMESTDVARIGVNQMLRGTPSVVTGALNKLMVWSNRLMTRRWAGSVAYRLTR